jgi:ribosomal protein S18 acetylase RimI-like enzyme
VFDILTSAFATDPAVRWMYPDRQQYLRFFPSFARAFGGAAFTRGTALLSEGNSGAALWLPPGSAPDEDALGPLLEESVAAPEKPDIFVLLEEMGSYHPAEPHWYLPLIGVEPGRQGQGHGSAMMAYGLRPCDGADLPAYLEATNPKNIPLYQRYGFEILGEIRIGRCPPVYPMLRAARKFLP